MEGIVAGRIVHFVMSDGPMVGSHRPAIIVGTYDPTHPDYRVNLGIFPDGTNDGYWQPQILWYPSVPFSEEAKPDTWHWIERA